MIETHDKADQSCETCAFMRKRGGEGDIAARYACHRRCPAGAINWYLRFPEVDKDDWCGEWDQAE